MFNTLWKFVHSLVSWDNIVNLGSAQHVTQCWKGLSSAIRVTFPQPTNVVTVCLVGHCGYYSATPITIMIIVIIVIIMPIITMKTFWQKCWLHAMIIAINCSNHDLSSLGLRTPGVWLGKLGASCQRRGSMPWRYLCIRTIKKHTTFYP